jgi:hypothetical protein
LVPAQEYWWKCKGDNIADAHRVPVRVDSHKGR